MSQRILWRVDHLTPQTLIHPDNLALGICRHLEHQADLIGVLMQIQTQQRTYVLLDGCTGCQYRQCRPGCRVLLLGRTLCAAGGVQVTLTPITQGLAERPYTRMALAWPRRDAPILSAAVLHPYADARLLLHWRHRALPRPTLTLAALLMVGTDGPDPVHALRQAGWWAMPVPTRLHAIWQTPTPRGLLPGMAWRGAPTLLLPQDIAATPVAQEYDPGAHLAPESETHPTWRMPTLASVPDMPIDALTAEVLPRLVQSLLRGYTLGSIAGSGGTTHTERAAPTDPAAHVPTNRHVADDERVPGPPPSIWPSGPGVGNGCIRPRDLETLVTAILRDATIMGDERPGLTRKRLVALLPDIWREHTQPLLAWFEAAGILAPPGDPEQPWRTPRPLVSIDPDQIAERLRTTPRPTVS